MSAAVDFKSNISLANIKVRMSEACSFIGMPDPGYIASGAKVECPFASVYHPDGQRSFRVYDDAGAYCYACGERYSPVSLYALARDISLEQAAEELLEKVGYIQLTAEERFENAVANPVPIDEDALAEALKSYCARNFPQWEMEQFEGEVAATFRKCVELLPAVKTAEDVRRWMSGTKTAMSRVLGKTHD